LLGLSSHGGNKNVCPILFGFHLNNSNYILNKCTRMMENQSKHENVIAIWVEIIKNSSTLKAELNKI
jgi:hypothetical protein